MSWHSPLVSVIVSADISCKNHRHERHLTGEKQIYKGTSHCCPCSILLPPRNHFRSVMFGLGARVTRITLRYIDPAETALYSKFKFVIDAETHRRCFADFLPMFY
jgi:hypothetical protein